MTKQGISHLAWANLAAHHRRRLEFWACMFLVTTLATIAVAVFFGWLALCFTPILAGILWKLLWHRVEFLECRILAGDAWK